MLGNEKLSALVVGLGSAGVRHLNNLCALGVRHLSAYRVRNLPPPAAVECPDLVVHHDLDVALAEKPDLVVVANPTALHLPVAQAAVEAGCHVFLEKPVAHRWEGCEALAAATAQNGSTVAVGCMLRFHPNLMAIREWLTAGRLGAVLSVQIDQGEYLPGWHPWEDYRESYAATRAGGGGVVLTMIHEIDYALWFFGMPRAVFAAGGQLTPLEVEVEDTALLTLAGEVPVQIRMDYWRRPGRRTMHVVGVEGEITWDYYAGRAQLHREGELLAESGVPEGWERNDMFRALLADLLDSIREGRSPRVDLQAGLDALRVALAAKTSMTSMEAMTL